MKLTISFHNNKDADIIKYLSVSDKQYKIKEAIRKAIQLDSMLERMFTGNKIPGTLTSKPVQTEEKIETSEEIPKLSDHEINHKLDTQF
jgi:hypothetical protein